MKADQSYNEVRYGQIRGYWDTHLNKNLLGREHTSNLKHECHERLRDERLASYSTCVKTAYLDAGFCVVTLRLKRGSRTGVLAEYQWALPLSYSYSYLREEMAIAISNWEYSGIDKPDTRKAGHRTRGFRDTVSATYLRTGLYKAPEMESSGSRLVSYEWDMEAEAPVPCQK